MAGRDAADPLSMRASIFAAIDIYRNRVKYDNLLKGKMEERRLEAEEDS